MEKLLAALETKSAARLIPTLPDSKKEEKADFGFVSHVFRRARFCPGGIGGGRDAVRQECASSVLHGSCI